MCIGNLSGLVTLPFRHGSSGPGDASQGELHRGSFRHSASTTLSLKRDEHGGAPFSFGCPDSLDRYLASQHNGPSWGLG